MIFSPAPAPVTACVWGLARPSLLPDQITGSHTSDVFYHGLALNNLNHLFYLFHSFPFA